ncbi:hypothetical protein BSL78_05028 [Apostichopus japonicus]|uniref:Uncharacterized protein n=1 Tax=Stichopus japonicus TaxID=307972 RepID=A0A2G8LCR6_STIJA|nr:hypothetical protein BSL78_05028 [Apostichopus japonicus]
MHCGRNDPCTKSFQKRKNVEEDDNPPDEGELQPFPSVGEAAMKAAGICPDSLAAESFNVDNIKPPVYDEPLPPLRWNHSTPQDQMGSRLDILLSIKTSEPLTVIPSCIIYMNYYENVNSNAAVSLMLKTFVSSVFWLFSSPPHLHPCGIQNPHLSNFFAGPNSKSSFRSKRDSPVFEETLLSFVDTWLLTASSGDDDGSFLLQPTLFNFLSVMKTKV